MPRSKELVGLTDAEIELFVQDGYVRIDNAFPRELADAVRQRLQQDLPCDLDDPTTWVAPAVRLGMYTDPPFVQAANTPQLHAAFDQLVGRDRWLPCGAMGTFRCAFPHPEEPVDAGWHVDVSFGTDDPDFMNWRVNVKSRGRALLMLFLFSDVGSCDAPTRLRRGSHLDIARQLAPGGDEGLTLGQLVEGEFASTAELPEDYAVGDAGTVYLCHPFLVHAAQPHRGTTPRILAQPPLLPRDELRVTGDSHGLSPVEAAIALAIGRL